MTFLLCTQQKAAAATATATSALVEGHAVKDCNLSSAGSLYCITPVKSGMFSI